MDCYKLFMALSSYTNGYASKEETRSLLHTLDLSHFETLEEPVKAAIRRILNEDLSEEAEQPVRYMQDTCSNTKKDNE